MEIVALCFVVLVLVAREEKRTHESLFPTGLPCVVCKLPLKHDGRNHCWLHPDGYEYGYSPESTWIPNDGWHAAIPNRSLLGEEDPIYD